MPLFKQIDNQIVLKEVMKSVIAGISWFGEITNIIYKEGGVRMKRKISGILAFILTFIIYEVALGGFAPPKPPPNPPANATGVYVKGYFTVAYDKANLPQFTHYNVHAVLEWVRTGVKEGMVKGIEKGKVGSFDLKELTKEVIQVKAVHLFSAAIPGPGRNLCEYDDDYIRGIYWDLPDKLGVPAAFRFPGYKAYITHIKIINKDSCGDVTKEEPGAMIRGEIEILLYIP